MCASVLTLSASPPAPEAQHSLPCPLQLNPSASLYLQEMDVSGLPVTASLPILNPPAGAGSGHQRFWAGMQEPISEVKCGGSFTTSNPCLWLLDVV